MSCTALRATAQVVGHQAPRPPRVCPCTRLPARRREVLVEGRRQHSHSDTGRSMLAAKSPHSWAPVAVSALMRCSCRVTQKDTRQICRAESGSVPQLAEVLEHWERCGVLDHFRRALPALRRTATVLFHAERASSRSRESASDIPALRAASASAPPAGAPLVRSSATASSPLRERRTEDEGGRLGALIGAAPHRTWGAGGASGRA
jgi:hypothetical protein